MKPRPFFVVLTVSLVLLPIYFFNLPMELAPHPSHQVINYFYDRRTYIGIHSVVASSNNNSSEKEVHLGNVRNLKGEEDLYRDDGGRNKEMNVHHSHDNKLANANVNQFSSNPPSPTSPSQFSSTPPSTSPSQFSSNPPSTSPSQNPYLLTNEQKKSIAQKKPKQLLPRLASIPQYLMSQVNSRLSALGLNSIGRKQSQEQLNQSHGAALKARQSHGAALKAKHKLAKRLSTLSRKQKVKMLMKVRLRQRLQMNVLPLAVNCTDDTCKKLKEVRERYYYEACLREAQKDYEVKPCQCSLLDGKKRGRYALLSLPGSGNTWVRGLLEKATGVCTGSMWCDASLRAKHFCMEGVRSTSVLVVKNHDTHLRWVGVKLGDGESVNNKPDFIGGILIHRNPFRATIAEWNRAAAMILTENVTDTPPQTKTQKAVPHPPMKTKPQKAVPHPQAVFNDAIKTETRKAVRMLHHNVTSDSLNATKNNHLSYFGSEMFGKCFFTVLRSTSKELGDTNIS